MKMCSVPEFASILGCSKAHLWTLLSRHGEIAPRPEKVVLRANYYSLREVRRFAAELARYKKSRQQLVSAEKAAAEIGVSPRSLRKIRLSRPDWLPDSSEFPGKLDLLAVRKAGIALRRGDLFPAIEGPDDELLSLTEAAKAMGITWQYLTRLLQADPKLLPATRLGEGGGRRFRRDAVRQAASRLWSKRLHLIWGK